MGRLSGLVWPVSGCQTGLPTGHGDEQLTLQTDQGVYDEKAFRSLVSSYD
jgi:hypothetical protein